MAPRGPRRRISLAPRRDRGYNGGMEQSLDLDIAKLVAPGRVAAELEFSIVRELRASDLALLAVSAGTPPVNIKKLSERHHALARLLAAGVSMQEAAAVTGYDYFRVGVLKGDPAFQELLAFYRGKVDEQFMSTMDQIAGLSQDVIREIRDRLEDKPEDFSVKELRELLVSTADRSGFGPTHKQVSEININLGQRLEEGRRRALEARRSMIRDITPPAEAAE